MYMYISLLLWRGKKILFDGAERVGERTTKKEDRKLETQSIGSKKKLTEWQHCQVGKKES